MLHLDNNIDVSEEDFAAWLDGTLSPEEDAVFMDACSFNSELQELLDVNDQVDETYENMVEVGFDLPEELFSDFDIPLVVESDYDDSIYPYEPLEPYEGNDDDMDEESASDSEECTNDDNVNDDMEDENSCLDLTLL